MPGPFPATADDYRERARRRLPGFLFDYLDGGSGVEATLAANVADWQRLTIRQRVLVDVSALDTAARLVGTPARIPLALAPVGIAGLMARRGEALAAGVAAREGLPFTLSTVGICGLDEVRAVAPCWFQLYMLRDRALVEALVERARAAGVEVLVFTVDLPLAGPRHRDARHGIGLGGLAPRIVRALELLARPRWLVDVGLLGRPHAFGSLVGLVPDARDPEAIRAFIDAQFDPGVTWRDIDWLRARWPGRLVLKGVLDPDDARRAVEAGADAIVVSNHGGRQLDGASSTARALPAIVEAVGDRTEVLVDGGIRSGLDLFRALALGARGALIGRAWAYAIAGGGAPGLARVLAGIRRELELAMALAGVTRIADIGRAALARLDDPLIR